MDQIAAWPMEERETLFRDTSELLAPLLPEFEVRTLDIARTFWEKATILHSLACGGAEKVRPRMARHYYDLALLADADESAGAATRVDLLESVARHKEKMFASAWASYGTARPGTLRLVPEPDVQKRLEKDYRDMGSLFMEEPPPFSEVIERLARLEDSINAPQMGTRRALDSD